MKGLARRLMTDETGLAPLRTNCVVKTAAMVGYQPGRLPGPARCPLFLPIRYSLALVAVPPVLFTMATTKRMTMGRT